MRKLSDNEDARVMLVVYGKPTDVPDPFFREDYAEKETVWGTGVTVAAKTIGVILTSVVSPV